MPLFKNCLVDLRLMGYIAMAAASSTFRPTPVEERVATLEARVSSLEKAVTVLSTDKLSSIESHLGVAFQEIGKCVKEVDLKSGFDSKMKLISQDISGKKAYIIQLDDEISKIDKAAEKLKELDDLLNDEQPDRLRLILEDSFNLARAELEGLGSRDEKTETIAQLRKDIDELGKLASTYTIFSYAVE